MLDSDTKRRIDACRDILVGKVPDPKSQVEQITIALIYKFMDDMDAEAEELGGKRTFFAGDYARYGWSQLMATGLGGFEVLALYSEAIATMPKNPGVPALFRDIFKNAYLPYRDPETLKSFLKEINFFSYDHSERLGDAFEYLLSVLGSQGDAGQFRTPRHIIDFMVEVMDPQKNETILDPACGTAGFLISAWKHILKNNSALRSVDAGQSPISLGNLLTPDERTRLAGGIKGYDISPDMVRLSLVNLYLHGFADPHIVEYDTLTSDERWNEVADVILANPPFMSPKGGIKPHKRFSVQATRSEVLFVDYMAEHLTPTGRAAIVVPEGIIFQSGTAYKALRKMLVDTSLVAVVSLPAGVFNPYSGVKTSILILDKRVHKQTESVLFVKVQNDGFNLGAQRRAVVNSDLPAALAAITNYKLRITNGKAVEEGDPELPSPLCQLVARSKIQANETFSLSSDRYLPYEERLGAYPNVTLGSVCEVSDGDHQAPPKADDGVPFITISNLDQQAGIDFSKTFFVSQEYFDRINPKRQPKKGDTLYSVTGSFGIAVFVDTDKVFCFQRHISLIRPSPMINAQYLHCILSSPFVRQQAQQAATGIAQKTVSLGSLRNFSIPLPPLEVQHQIVAEIEGYQVEITNLELEITKLKGKITTTVNKVWGGDEN